MKKIITPPRMKPSMAPTTPAVPIQSPVETTHPHPIMAPKAIIRMSMELKVLLKFEFVLVCVSIVVPSECVLCDGIAVRSSLPRAARRIVCYSFSISTSRSRYWQVFSQPSRLLSMSRSRWVRSPRFVPVMYWCRLRLRSSL